MADSEDITQLIATARVLDQWRSAEVTMQARGVHRVPDGSLYLQVEYLIEVQVPDHNAAKRLLDVIDGKVAPAEAKPVATGEQLQLGSDAGESAPHDAGPDSGEG